MRGSHSQSTALGDEMSQVFVSYNREDLPIAQRIVDGLIAEGFDVWMDMNLQAGENYDEITEERLHKARAVVVLWSSRSVKSRWVRAEATIGARKNTLVPLMIEPCDRPVMFELIQSTDLSGWNGDRTDPSWLACIEVIRRRLEAVPVEGGGSFAHKGKTKAAAKAAAKARKQREAKAKSGKSVLVTHLMAFSFGLMTAVGVYVLRPDLAQPLLAMLPEYPVQNVANASEPLAADAALVSVVETPPPIAEPVIEAPPEPEAPVTFKACDMCPDMVTIAGGTFMMGAPEDELARNAWEGPQRKVAMAPFAIATTEVTYDQWDACVADGGCAAYSPPAGTQGRGAQPVAKVSWKDAQAYTSWLSKKSDRTYRLPSEAEWEYAARAGTDTPFWWGALFDAGKAATGPDLLAVTALEENAFHLRGVSGSLREWVQDCYVNTYANAPLDGRAVEVPACKQRVVRGGSHVSTPAELRIAGRTKADSALRDDLTGFRVAAAP
jgi:formylglycine-generating enzyme required for sulfatase activity